MAFILTELPDGFDCQVVTPFWNSEKCKFRLEDNKFWINKWPCSIGFLNSHHYIKTIFNELYRTYKPQKYKKTWKSNKDFQISKIRESIIKKQGKMHSRKIASQLNRLRKLVDQDMLQIEKNCISYFGPKEGFSQFYYITRLIDRIDRTDEHLKKYLIKDLLKYKVLLNVVINENNYIVDWINKCTRGSNIFAKRSFLENKKHIPGFRELPHCNFNEVLNSTQLLIYKMLQYDRNYDEPNGVKIGPFSLKDIKKASKIYAARFNQKSNLRKRRYVLQFCQYIVDYLRVNPNDTKCTLTTLTRRSIFWHRTADFSKMLNGYSPNQKTAELPTFLQKEISEYEEIKFLETVEEVANEGSSMGHCVASYAGSAVRGTSYLFHIDKFNERATVELRRNFERLEMSQSRGPYNETNKASKWAEKIFNKILSNDTSTNLPQLQTVTEEELPF